jgi:hypothetical protein
MPRESGKPSTVPHAALHAVGQQIKRLKARITELENLAAVLLAVACVRANINLLSLLPPSKGYAEAERNGLVRSPSKTGEDPTGERAGRIVSHPILQVDP